MAGKVTLNGELMFPSEYLAAVEFKGRDVTLTIAKVSKDSLKTTDGKNKVALVIRFNGTQKKLVCNKTNANSIAELYGTRAEQWIGKRITLYPTTCPAFGKTVDCIRIRETVPRANGQQQQPAPPPEPDPLPPDDPVFGDDPLGANDDLPTDAPTQEEEPGEQWHPLTMQLAEKAKCEPFKADVVLRDMVRASPLACDLEDLTEPQAGEYAKLIRTGKIKV